MPPARRGRPRGSGQPGSRASRSRSTRRSGRSNSAPPTAPSPRTAPSPPSAPSSVPPSSVPPQPSSSTNATTAGQDEDDVGMGEPPETSIPASNPPDGSNTPSFGNGPSNPSRGSSTSYGFDPMRDVSDTLPFVHLAEPTPAGMCTRPIAQDILDDVIIPLSDSPTRNEVFISDGSLTTVIWHLRHIEEVAFLLSCGLVWPDSIANARAYPYLTNNAQSSLTPHNRDNLLLGLAELASVAEGIITPSNPASSVMVPFISLVMLNPANFNPIPSPIFAAAPVESTLYSKINESRNVIWGTNLQCLSPALQESIRQVKSWYSASQFSSYSPQSILAFYLPAELQAAVDFLITAAMAQTTISEDADSYAFTGSQNEGSTQGNMTLSQVKNLFPSMLHFLFELSSEFVLNDEESLPIVALSLTTQMLTLPAFTNDRRKLRFIQRPGHRAVQPRMASARAFLEDRENWDAIAKQAFPDRSASNNNNRSSRSSSVPSGDTGRNQQNSAPTDPQNGRTSFPGSPPQGGPSSQHQQRQGSQSGDAAHNEDQPTNQHTSSSTHNASTSGPAAGGNLFGGNNTRFGNDNSTFSNMGSFPTSGLFGDPNLSRSAFGGQPSVSGNATFGNNTSSSTFGSQPFGGATFGNNASSNTFGSQPSGSATFGNNASSSTFGGQPPFNSSNFRSDAAFGDPPSATQPPSQGNASSFTFGNMNGEQPSQGNASSFTFGNMNGEQSQHHQHSAGASFGNPNSSFANGNGSFGNPTGDNSQSQPWHESPNGSNNWNSFWNNNTSYWSSHGRCDGRDSYSELMKNDYLSSVPLSESLLSVKSPYYDSVPIITSGKASWGTLKECAIVSTGKDDKKLSPPIARHMQRTLLSAILECPLLVGSDQYKNPVFTTPPPVPNQIDWIPPVIQHMRDLCRAKWDNEKLIVFQNLQDVSKFSDATDEEMDFKLVYCYSRLAGPPDESSAKSLLASTIMVLSRQSPLMSPITPPNTRDLGSYYQIVRDLARRRMPLQCEDLYISVKEDGTKDRIATEKKVAEVTQAFSRISKANEGLDLMAISASSLSLAEPDARHSDDIDVNDLLLISFSKCLSLDRTAVVSVTPTLSEPDVRNMISTLRKKSNRDNLENILFSMARTSRQQVYDSISAPKFVIDFVRGLVRECSFLPDKANSTPAPKTQSGTEWKDDWGSWKKGDYNAWGGGWKNDNWKDDWKSGGGYYQNQQYNYQQNAPNPPQPAPPSAPPAPPLACWQPPLSLTARLADKSRHVADFMEGSAWASAVLNSGSITFPLVYSNLGGGRPPLVFNTKAELLQQCKVTEDRERQSIGLVREGNRCGFYCFHVPHQAKKPCQRDHSFPSIGQILAEQERNLPPALKRPPRRVPLE